MCCKTCMSTNGCQNGKIDKAIGYRALGQQRCCHWRSSGYKHRMYCKFFRNTLKSFFKSSKGCKPIKPINTRTPPACKQIYTNSNYQIHYNNDKHFGETSYRVQRKDIVQRQIKIMMHGLVMSNFDVMNDFVSYIVVSIWL
jgi:hypothetical protein